MPKPSVRALWAARLREGAGAKSRPAPVPLSATRAAFRGTILGIDPSLRGTGLAVVLFVPPEKGRHIFSETVNPPKGASLPECLGAIAAAVERLIAAHAPDAVAVEETIYVQNFRTAQKLGAARGAAIGQAALRGLPVFEYSPLRIKQAVVGYGRASKEQVARQMSGLLGLSRQLPFDEADAAAAAWCHAMTEGRALAPM
jgi:crossover junction endodeoxyribonuclease RuvC